MLRIRWHNVRSTSAASRRLSLGLPLRHGGQTSFESSDDDQKNPSGSPTSPTAAPVIPVAAGSSTRWVSSLRRIVSRYVRKREFPAVAATRETTRAILQEIQLPVFWTFHNVTSRNIFRKRDIHETFYSRALKLLCKIDDLWYIYFLFLFRYEKFFHVIFFILLISIANFFQDTADFF